MAKRKRLTPANPMFIDVPAQDAPPSVMRAPIADVVGDSSTSAALEQLSHEIAEARATGRMISALPLDRIDQSYLVRDRLVVDDDEMSALIASIRDRGQQAAIEVVRLDGDRFGLISGWRRCQAIASLHEMGAGDGTVLAIERRPETASDAYRAMVEENEIRSGLSYFERARIVELSVQHGVYESHKAALQTLFATASRAKRSKIGSFVTLVQLLGDHLKFPAAIGERLGLRLARLIGLSPHGADDLAAACSASRPDTPDVELSVLSKWADKMEKAKQCGNAPLPSDKSSKPAPQILHPRPDLQLRFHPAQGRLELSGKGLTDDLRADLVAWLAQRGA